MWAAQALRTPSSATLGPKSSGLFFSGLEQADSTMIELATIADRKNNLQKREMHFTLQSPSQ
jgi:hypothetical protein